MSSWTVHQRKVLQLYRSIIKAALEMPTQNRRDWIRNKARLDFKQNKYETDPEQIDLHVRLGETQLENIEIQAKNLQRFIQMEPQAKFTNIKYTQPAPAPKPRNMNRDIASMYSGGDQQKI